MPSSWRLLLAVPGLLMSQALALPRSLTDDPIRTTPSLLERHPELNFVRELDNSQAYIRFTVPSGGGVDDENERSSSQYKTFELRVLPRPEACGTTAVVLNNQSLSLQWNGASTTGHTSISIETSRERGFKQVPITWTLSCLDSKPEPLQLLAVTLNTKSAHDRELSPSPYGFTISFNQRSPRLISISPSPYSYSHEAAEASQSQSPFAQEILPVTIFSVGDREDDVSSLELELEKLRLLSHVTGTYADVVNGQRRVIDKLIIQRIKEAKANFHDCTSLRCMIKVTFQLTKHAMDKVCARYDHPAFIKSFFSSSSACPSEVTSLAGVLPYHQGQTRIAMVQEDPEYCLKQAGFSSYAPTKSSWSSKILRPFLSSDEPHHASVDTYDGSTFLGSQYEFIDSDLVEEKLLWAMDPQKIMILRLLSAVIISGMLAGLFLCIRHRCCSPRAKAERRARYEERRTRRQYRCLAKRHAWRTWWKNHWLIKDKRIVEYEDKRALIIAQEAILEAEMQRRIDNLRFPQVLSPNPSDRAEQGMNLPLIDDGLPLSRSSSLPSYRSRASSGRPPSYKEIDEISRSTVADGFSSYTPTDTTFTPEGTDLTPDSSVFGLSPRHSCESLRTYYYQV